MANRGKNISVYLMDGDATGRMKATIANWTGVEYRIQRHALDLCKDRDDLKQSGVYFLFGVDDQSGDNVVYIGQAGARKNGEGILNRLAEHKRNPDKDYWTEAVVFTTSNNSFGPTEISYLENRFCGMAQNAKRYTVKNGNDPTHGNITEEKESELEEFVDFARLIMGVLGHMDFSYSEYLIQLLENKKIDAVGECGFDFFTQDFRSMSQKQEKVWNFQLEAAIKYGKPLVIHGRKCTERLFKDIKLLKKVKGVVFHSWAGTLTEANSLLKKGVNAYFSFGKPILNGKKSAVECVKFLEESRIVFETDAPYQTLKGEEKTLPEDILKVYEQAEKLRGKKIEPDITSLFKN